MTDRIQVFPGGESDVRSLTGSEVMELESVFGDSMNYSEIQVKRYNGPLDTMHVVGNTINIPEGSNSLNSGNLGFKYMDDLVHEATHVWQHQSGFPGRYAVESVISYASSAAQAVEMQGSTNSTNILTGLAVDTERFNRDAAYDAAGAHEAGIPFYSMGTEHQAEITRWNYQQNNGYINHESEPDLGYGVTQKYVQDYVKDSDNSYRGNSSRYRTRQSREQFGRDVKRLFKDSSSYIEGVYKW